MRISHAPTGPSGPQCALRTDQISASPNPARITATLSSKFPAKMPRLSTIGSRRPPTRSSLHAGGADRRFRIAGDDPLEVPDVEAGPLAAEDGRSLAAPAIDDFDASVEIFRPARVREDGVT